MTAPLVPSGACWVCNHSVLTPIHRPIFDLSIYQQQDPALAAYTGAAITLIRCSRCGFAQPDALPELERFFGRMYDQRWSREWIASEFDSPAKSRIFEEILDELASRVRGSTRRLIDVGAHVGQFVAAARSRGWQAEGIELNPTTAAYARERTGATIAQHPLSDVARDGAGFDALTLIDVLEHIPSPVSTLRDAAAVLKPGGCIAVKVPCGRSQLWKEQLRLALGLAGRVSVADNLVHVSHFSPKALRLALEQAGFDRITIGVGRPEQSLAGSRTRRLLVNAGRRTLHAIARSLPGGVHTPLAFNLQAFACRREGDR
jgi:SAM-dependent methyltransferase